ncbi:MAG: hypothetical protein KKC58_04665 [Gammaproteobacteria bacterium]|nr:hypothetical protein [Gammaproteobacteria bacterium]
MEQEITEFFTKYIDELDVDSGGGGWPQVPDFELLPRDFLDFAEKDLEAPRSTHTLVNATSNLKRAVDCQLDYLLCTLNLDEFYRNKRLGIDRKLGLLKRAGIFRSRSIEKLNALRNRLEHHYEKPKIEDVEVYYDLVAAFVSVLESVIPLAGFQSNLSNGLVCGGGVESDFSREQPRLRLTLEHNPSGYKKVFEVDLSASTDVATDIENFAYLLRVHMLLRKLEDSAITPPHFLKALEGSERV